MKSSHASKKGLTLVEVLLALVILSVGVSSMMMAMSRCLSVVRTARNLDVARGLIQRIDLEFPIETVDMAELTESGTFDDAEGYTWFREIMVVDEEERPGLFLVTLRVQWSERGRNSFEEVTMYKYAPDAESVTSQIETN
ncbi:prepilin-type N-terminal cleavage/methylation domain-containing protein [Pontiellaceae bacterium B12219]|nr:prepilin-type N-terminal cleavage/methylation domain-containing protein [Pontiellaceae bacterium B12219]